MAKNNQNDRSGRHMPVPEIGREIFNQADSVRRDVVKQLCDVADSIRSRARSVEGDTRDNANRIARNLEQTANYLNGRAIDQMEDTTEMMREHVWETTLIAFLIGLVLGLLIGYSGND